MTGNRAGGPTRALLVVDVQNDFTEGGSLAVDGGDRVATTIGAYAAANRDSYAVIATTQDFHHDPGPHFSSTPDFVDSWPVHCAAGTTGAELDPLLDTGAGRSFTDLVDVTVRKGAYAAAYSGFEGVTADGATLEERLVAAGVDRVDVVGIATDHCVRATALDSVAAGFVTRVLLDMCAGVAEATTAAALSEMEAADVQVVRVGTTTH